MSELNCQECAACCIARTEVWLPVTREEAAKLPFKFKETPTWRAIVVMPGEPCPGLKDKLCTVYDKRPYVCRAVVVGGPECLEARRVVLNGR